MSFSFLGTFRVGQWRDFRKFVLNERRDIDAIVDVIDAELKRIGDIIVTYDKRVVSAPQPDGSTKETMTVTEKRLGMFVTKGTSLDKLLKAYIAYGGNPLDISMFLKPESALFQNEDGSGADPDEESRTMTGLERVYPHDGVVAPETPATFNPAGGVYEGGFLTWGKYPWRRFGGQMSDQDLNPHLAARIDHARRWCQQAIFEKRNHIEAKIIKLMDLREQLELERDEILVQAVGGTGRARTELPNTDDFHPDFHLSNIVGDIDRVIWQEADNGGVDPTRLNDSRFDYVTILDDEPDEENTAL